MHQPVLLKEVIDFLNFQSGNIFLDGTLGNGGHSLKVYETFPEQIKIIGIDKDQEALERTRKKMKDLGIETKNIILELANFRDLDKVLEKEKLNRVDRILLDLGINSDQLENSGRGFSFQKNEPLLMNMKKDLTELDLTAMEIVNSWEEKNIADILYGFGEESFSRQIAKEIVLMRKREKIKTTFDLVKIIKQAVPMRYQRKKIHPATKTFQALRITVNDELGALKEGLEKGFKSLNPNGRIAIITFHSLEDRLVKNYFRDLKKAGLGITINKKVIQPSREEIKINPRSRSAKLRVFEKL